MDQKNFDVSNDYVNCSKSKHNEISNSWYQQLTSFSLILLMLWFLYALFNQIPSSYNDVIIWIKSPCNTIAIISLLLMMIYRTYLGWQIVLKDYTHKPGLRLFLIIILKILSISLIIISIGTVTRIHSIAFPSVIECHIDAVVHQGDP